MNDIWTELKLLIIFSNLISYLYLYNLIGFISLINNMVLTITLIPIFGISKIYPIKT